jgi:hypothetical protein
MLYSNAVRKKQMVEGIGCNVFGGVGGEYPSQDGNDVDVVRVKKGHSH